MKCLFILKYSATNEQVKLTTQHEDGWDNKMDAKKERDRLLREDEVDTYVSKGHEHDDRVGVGGKRRRKVSLKRRAHRTQANMGQPQPAKRAEKLRRAAAK